MQTYSINPQAQKNKIVCDTHLFEILCILFPKKKKLKCLLVNEKMILHCGFLFFQILLFAWIVRTRRKKKLLRKCFLYYYMLLAYVNMWLFIVIATKMILALMLLWCNGWMNGTFWEKRISFGVEKQKRQTERENNPNFFEIYRFFRSFLLSCVCGNI